MAWDSLRRVPLADVLAAVMILCVVATCAVSLLGLPITASWPSTLVALTFAGVLHKTVKYFAPAPPSSPPEEALDR